ncbi:MAG TPA: hypothetical protein DEP84_01895 [Chloroflexi bacterium]|nr:hypothetical protein [Chloroflexota bacterium]
MSARHSWSQIEALMPDPTAKPKPPLTLAAPLTCLDADLVGRIDRALTRVGDFGQVRLIVVNGRLRFIEVLQSESVDDRMVILPRIARIDTNWLSSCSCQFGATITFSWGRMRV